MIGLFCVAALREWNRLSYEKLSFLKTYGDRFFFCVAALREWNRLSYDLRASSYNVYKANLKDISLEASILDCIL